MLDFYRKTHDDFVKQTSHGAVLSICAGMFMLILFIVELMAFMSTTVNTSVILDTNADVQLRINFNITMIDMPCEFASIDVYDVLGTNTQNVTKNIEKWQLDENGIKRIFSGRNKEQKAIQHDTHHPDIETLHENGVHATPIGIDTFDEFVKDHKFSFVNFYAPWCVWCQRLEPTWEAFAEELEKLDGTPDEIQVDVAKVDCVANRQLCADQRVMAFPTLRLFKDGEIFAPDYKMDRTITALKEYAKSKLDLEEKMKEWHPKRRERIENQNKEHPGCLLTGHLLVNRVPGNFHLEARSNQHNLNAAMTNVSHIVNHLSFGQPLQKDQLKKMKRFPEFSESISPLDSSVFVNRDFHQSYHHYSKVVSTHYEVDSVLSHKSNILGYQILAQSQIMHYGEDDVPEAKFSYDLSPMAVVLSNKGRRWYDFITSLCAIIGGTFTVVGLLDTLLHKFQGAGKGL
jgi:thiol-disulfide isomerase/thioredoxin